MLTSSQIRRQFIDFFVQKHAHAHVPSSPVVPHDDPTLLFTNAGMNQFKPLFLGQEQRGYTRAANSQKCIRAGGKHNDLDDVGRSRRHHTFFEMLGNWSFGDYFKAEAIQWAWDLLTNVWKLDPQRLHVTCFEGDEKNGVPRDTEAADLWKTLCNVPEERIHYFGKDNFWEMGDTGPCGPCTEIHIDRTPDKSGRSLVGGEDPRVMEIWNLVFIQYNRNADRSLTPLPARHVDTGMGFERITQILQEANSNYDIDLWNPFWAKLADLSGHKYQGKFPRTNAPDPAAEAADPQLRTDIAFRVIGDHVRCLTFALTDGAVPSNEGRGYVLRRILRRAVRFGRQTLGLGEPFMHKMVDVVVDTMGEAFPELKQNPRHVAEIVRDEEVSFGRTLSRGIAIFDAALAFAAGRAYAATRGPDVILTGSDRAVAYRGEDDERETAAMQQLAQGLQFFSKSTKQQWRLGTQEVLKHLAERNVRATLPAESAFKLHDTYGFPIDLTQQMAVERGMSVDIEGYEKLMEEAREKARAAGKGGDSPVYTLPPGVIAELQRQGVQPTDDSHKFDPVEQGCSATVRAIWNGSNLDPSADTSEDQEIAVILDRTNFYAEMGGQVGDSGQLASTSSNFDVETTRVVGGYVLHVGRVAIGKLHVGDPVKAVVSDRRVQTQQNHTGTHVLNWALREVLGEGVQQKGSLVDPDKLRFDFSHGKAMSDEQVQRVEQLANEAVAKAMPVYAETAPLESAMKINGLRAVFGEKYPAQVRVVSIGAPVADLLENPGDDRWRRLSIEFCGGTHVANSREIGAIVLTSEESVSKGVRRLVALTGEAAAKADVVARAMSAEFQRVRSLPESQLSGAMTELQRKLGGDDVPLRSRRAGQALIAELQDRVKKWEKAQKASGATSLEVSTVAEELLVGAAALGRGRIVVAEVPGASDEQLRSVLDSLRKRQPTGLGALLAATDGQKVSFVAVVSDDLVAGGLKAGDWVREAAKASGGGGGGRPQMAQAGGKDPSKLPSALETARSWARSVLG